MDRTVTIPEAELARLTAAAGLLDDLRRRLAEVEGLGAGYVADVVCTVLGVELEA